MSRFVVLVLAAVVGAANCCDKGFVETSDGTCLPYATQYHDACSDDAQCQWLGDNSECKYVCRCKEGYRWYLGECRRYLGLDGNCTKDIDCYDGYNLQSLFCNSGTCSCSEGYYRRGSVDCRKIATEIGDSCALDLDCQIPDVDTFCHVGRCTTNSSPSNFEEEVEVMKETQWGYHVYSATSCDSNKDCTGIPNSVCFEETGTCICEKQYFFNDDGTACIAELGVNSTCKSDADCPIKPGKCEDGVCYCRDYYFVEDGNRNCVKSFIQDNWNCVSKEWCYALGSESYCTSNETCSCSSMAVYNDNDMTCNKTSTNDTLCSNDYDCKYITNGFCVDELCGCKPHFQLQNNSCIPNDIGAPCSEYSPCVIENSSCQDDYCQCIENYVPYETKACYPKSDLGNSCELDVQCFATTVYSACFNQTCECDDRHTPYNETCYAKTEYGSYCNSHIECALSAPKEMYDSIVCRNRVCQCPTGFTKVGNICSGGHKTIGSALILAALILKSVFSIS